MSAINDLLSCQIKTPPPVAYCSDDLCKREPGFCSDTDQGEAAQVTQSHAEEHVNSISRRGGARDYLAGWEGRPGARYTAFSYFSLLPMFLAQTPGFLRTLYRVVVGPCRSPSVDEQIIPLTRTLRLEDLSQYEAEHIIDVSSEIIAGRDSTDTSAAKHTSILHHRKCKAQRRQRQIV